jgi:hypothetical protein
VLRERILLAGFALVVVLSGVTVVWPELSGDTAPSSPASGLKPGAPGKAKPGATSPGV